MSLPRPRPLDRNPRLRHGPALVETSLLLMPAIRALSAAGDDRHALADAIDELPTDLLAPLIEYGFSRHVIRWSTMRALVIAAGADRLVEHFGATEAMAIVDRYSS